MIKTKNKKNARAKRKGKRLENEEGFEQQWGMSGGNRTEMLLNAEHAGRKISAMLFILHRAK